MQVRASRLSTSPVPQVVAGLLPQEGVGVLWGPSGDGKSLVVNAAGLAIANGLSFLGRETIRGPVVWCIGEGHHDAGIRLHAMQYAAAWAGFTLSIDDILIDDEPFMLRNDGKVSLAAMRWQREDLALVVLDAASYFGNTDNSQAAVAMMRGAQELARKLRTLVLLIHHTDKTGDQFRGAQALYDLSDVFLHLARGVLTVQKQKAAPIEAPLEFAIEKVHWRDPETDEIVRSALVRGVTTDNWGDELDARMRPGALQAHMHERFAAILDDANLYDWAAAQLQRDGIRLAPRPSEPPAIEDGGTGAPEGAGEHLIGLTGVPVLVRDADLEGNRRSWVKPLPPGQLAVM